MYFWSIDELIEDLKSEKVTEHDKKNYLVALLFTTTFVIKSHLHLVELYIFKNETLNDGLQFFLQCFILIWGINNCYKINKKNAENKDFITRFICLSFPLMIRFVIFGFFIFIFTSYFIITHIENHFSELYRIKFMLNICGIYRILLTIVFYHQLGKKFAAISNVKQDKNLNFIYQNT